ncbi:hypothetical protein DERP_013036 [Dermatophagoides pteronyssinus]|uniref:Uncharacterized protein n=1 Tax=Dermatophagoides pteronyssinus TaxID=6956 RepID=A0ABQ8JQG8_DERPT|nr:hypothetical protein DERP_013036 [Dermatophagoides pteronyssinus]
MIMMILGGILIYSTFFFSCYTNHDISKLDPDNDNGPPKMKKLLIIILFSVEKKSFLISLLSNE